MIESRVMLVLRLFDQIDPNQLTLDLKLMAFMRQILSE